MNFNLKLMALLAIFCVVLSVGFVSATENIAGGSDVNGISMSDDNGSVAAVAEDASGEFADHGVPYHADGTNATGEIPENSTGNSTNSTTTAHNLPATGNPILALLAVSAIIGAYTIKRK